MPKKSIVKDAEVAALVLLAAIVFGCMTYLTANHILPSDLSSIADSGMLVTIIGAIFHRLGLHSLPISTLESIMTQFSSAVQQAQPQALSAPVEAPAQPTPSNVVPMPSAPKPVDSAFNQQVA